MIEENKMGVANVPKLIVTMGLPMILSMVLQALYNVVDTVFVINMGQDGPIGNLALSAAFPVQIFMIAVGVGTGVGINALLSESLGKRESETATKVVGNGLFLAGVFFVLFLLFGLFLSGPYMRLMSSDPKVVEMGKEYLTIVCCISIGSIGFAVAERFLIASGRTNLSMIAQVSGAGANILLDYVFIYPLHMGIAGAAYATVIGQVLSFGLALLFHFLKDKEIKNSVKSLFPDKRVIGGIYRIGLPAFLMQGMLALTMFGCLLIIGTIGDEHVAKVLSGGYGIYYKLMQIALFAAFGLSNTLISVVGYNRGAGDYRRVLAAAKYGELFTLLVTALIAVVYIAAAEPIARLFTLTVEESGEIKKSELIAVTTIALRISGASYLFMGVSVAAQGVLQGAGRVWSPPIISLLRLIVLVYPTMYLFTRTLDPIGNIWWTYPIAEGCTAIVSLFFLVRTLKALKSELGTPKEGKMTKETCSSEEGEETIDNRATA